MLPILARVAFPFDHFRRHPIRGSFQPRTVVVFGGGVVVGVVGVVRTAPPTQRQNRLAGDGTIVLKFGCPKIS